MNKNKITILDVVCFFSLSPNANAKYMNESQSRRRKSDEYFVIEYVLNYNFFGGSNSRQYENIEYETNRSPFTFTANV